MNPTRQSAVESTGIVLVLLLSLPLVVNLGYQLLYRPLVYTDQHIQRQDRAEVERARERAKKGQWPEPWQIVKTSYIIGMLVVLTAVGAILTAGQLKYRRRRRHTSAWLCPNCGYDVRTSQHRCPECGGLIGRGPMTSYDAIVPPKARSLRARIRRDEDEGDGTQDAADSYD